EPTTSSQPSHDHYQHEEEIVEEKRSLETPRPFRTSLIDSLRDRFPNGPPETYDEFIQVSLSNIPPGIIDNYESEFPTQRTKVSTLRTLFNATSQLITSTAASMVSSSDSQKLRPIISYPKRIEPTNSKPSRSPVQSSPVQFYTQSFTGVGPPPPLPSPSDVLDIRPLSRNTTRRSHSSHGHSRVSGDQPRRHILIDVAQPTLYPPTQSDAVNKDPSTFPRQIQAKRKTVRIVTPHKTQKMSNPKKRPKSGNRVVGLFAGFTSLFSITLEDIIHILTFSDPAHSLFVLGFFTGPQTWLLGGFYVPSMDRHDRKSRLRVWVGKKIEQIRDGTPKPSVERASDELLERIERASSRLTSESFEIGRHTASDSNNSRPRLQSNVPSPANTRAASQYLDIPRQSTPSDAPHIHFRSFLAVPNGPKGPNLSAVLNDLEELGVNPERSVWIRRLVKATLYLKELNYIIENI
ncbi:7048_t:CDS:2, partial [Acaulospora colombiana]